MNFSKLSFDCVYYLTLAVALSDVHSNLCLENQRPRAGPGRAVKEIGTIFSSGTIPVSTELGSSADDT